MQRFVISNSDLKEIAQEQSVCRACELSIKRNMKKENGEVQAYMASSGRLFRGVGNGGARGA